MASVTTSLDNFSYRTTELIKKLRRLREIMTEKHSEYSFVKVVGTVLSLVGIMGVFTLTRKTAISAATGGLIMNWFASAADKEVSQNILAHVKKLLDDFAIEMASVEPVVNYIVRVLAGNEEKIALFIGSRARIETSFQSAAQLANEERAIGELQKLITLLKGKDIPKLIVHLKSEGYAFAAMIEDIFQLLPCLENTLENSSVEFVELMSDIALYLQGFIQLAVIMVDVRSCIREHPTVERIDKIVPKLESIKIEYQFIREQLININNTRGLVALME